MKTQKKGKKKNSRLGVKQQEGEECSDVESSDTSWHRKGWEASSSAPTAGGSELIQGLALKGDRMEKKKNILKKH